MFHQPTYSIRHCINQLNQLKKEQMKALSKIIDADNHINEDWDTTK
jgi:hypothetical protein